MRPSDYLKDIEILLRDGRPLALDDFVRAWPDVPMPTVYSRIRVLLREGRISRMGKGIYCAMHKPDYEVIVSEWMHKVNDWLKNQCEGVNHCLYEQGGNLMVEVPRSDIPVVLESLKRMSPKAVLRKDADAFPAILEGYVIVGALVTDSPLIEEENVSVPSLEKTLVDKLADGGKDEKERQFSFQKAMEVYPVNISRMKRYASRRGVRGELENGLAALDTDRMDMFSAIQKYLADIPVIRAWVFGSFARGEETPESDLDLLVDYDYSSHLSLLDIIGFQKALKKLLGREVDWVENGYLRPFAVPSAERDKYLIYER